jgi:polyvinyl alcohol dehydrogenase (cytochrome)
MSEIAKRLTTLAVTMCALCVLGGNWPQYRHDVANSGFTAGGDERSLRQGWTYRADSRITSSPVIDAGLVFAGTWKGDVIALDDRTGAVRWRYHLGANSDETYGGPRGVIGSIAVRGGIAYAASGNCELAALRETDGLRLWQTTICDNRRNDDVYASPVVTGDLVLVGIDLFSDRPTDRGRVIAYDATTGKRRWTYEPARYAGPGPGVSATPAIDPGGSIAFIGTGNPLPRDNPPPGPDPGSESIIALDLHTQKLLWTFGPVHPHDVNDEDFFASPNLIDIGPQRRSHWLVGEGNKDGTYYAVDARSGAKLWSTTIPGGSASASILGTAAVAEDTIFVPLYDSDRGSLTALRASDGRVMWQRQTGGEYEAPLVWGTTVFTTETTGRLLAFAAGTGKPLGSWPICTPALGRGPSAAGNALYVASGTCLEKLAE